MRTLSSGSFYRDSLTTKPKMLRTTGYVRNAFFVGVPFLIRRMVAAISHTQHNSGKPFSV